MSAVPKPTYSSDDYLALEEYADYRSQYYFGEIFAMAGASRRHSNVVINVAASIYWQLRNRSGEVYQSNMRVKVSPQFYTYPDIVIIRGERVIEKKNGENLTNPTVVIEVLSPATEKFDRGDKFRLYRLMPSVKEYLLISQDKLSIEHYVRQANNAWVLNSFSEAGDIVELPSVSCRLSVADVYEKVDFSEETED